MADLIEILKSFNRKERFFLVGAALGNPEFKLSKDYRKELSKRAGVGKIPADAFVAMDYHLDWLHASLFIWNHGNSGDEGPFCNDIGVSTGNQQDIDLFVAFKVEEVYHLILIEAKVYSSWDNKQMRLKAKRLCQIFGSNGDEYPKIKPHLYLTSPQCPQKLDIDEWPRWMIKNGKASWLKLCVPSKRRTVIGWDAKEEKSSKKRRRFKIRKQTHFKRDD